MHNACETAGNIALCEIIAKAAQEKGHDVNKLNEESIFVGMDYRKRSNMSSIDKQNYVAVHSVAITKNIDIAKWKDVDCFWDLARQVQSENRKHLKNHMKSTILEYTIGSFMLCNASKFVKYFRREKRRHLLGYTSNGNCNYLNRQSGYGIKIGGILSGFGIHFYGWGFYHHIITVDNKIIWDVNYTTNMCNREFAEKYLQRCVSILEDMCVNDNLNSVSSKL